MHPPRVAIIADDLTGALDVCAPFARRGLRCRVAVTPAGVEGALAGGADVVCVNTASRELDTEAARACVLEVAERMAQARPEIVFKKIDSRMKGHVSAEIDAAMTGFGLDQALVAPAVPAQERFVRDGRIVGKGVAEPIDVAGRLDGRRWTVGDGASDADMQGLVDRYGDSHMLVGASGLGAGLARALTGREASALLSAAQPLLIAIGSHDPVTLAQVERLRERPGIAGFETENGLIEEAMPADGVTLVRAVGDPRHEGHGDALARFGFAVASQLRSGRFASALLCGGETAQTVLNALGMLELELCGEALPGIAIAEARLSGRILTILTKSGGFGTSDDLVRIADAARPANPPIDPNRAGIPA